MQTPFFICIEAGMEILIETIIDNLKLFPFLLVTYLLLEYIEHKTSEKITGYIRRADFSGPIIGGLCGAIPQCGLSAVAANFYAVRIIGLGTLIAVFLSTSDEMLPILISENSTPPLLIIKIIGFKIFCAIVSGYIINFICHTYKHREKINIEQLCSAEGCSCKDGIFISALYHSISITLFIFIITLMLNYALEYLPISALISYLRIPLLGELISGIIGLIPNCSASVILTQLYLENYITIGTMMSGSLVSGGVGLLILFRVNRRPKENLYIVFLLYLFGICGGLLAHLVFA